LFACKSLKTDIETNQKPLPSNYGNSLDTLNIATLNWRQYFEDSLLTQLIDSAISENLDLKMAWQRIETARAQTKIALGNQLPTVSANTAYLQRKFGFYTMDDAGNRVTEFTPGDTIPTHLPDYNVGLTATWEVDIWGKLRNQRKSALSNYLASVEGRKFVISNLVAEVAVAYYELLALDNELEIILQTIQKQEEALEVIKLQKETGRSNELAAQQFEAQLLGFKSMEFETKQQIARKENHINYLMGRFPQSIPRLKESLFNSSNHSFSAGVPSQLLLNRPDIRAAEFELAATKFDVKSAKASFYPSLNLSAGFGFQAYNPQFLFLSPASNAYSLLGSLMMPVVNRKAIKAHFNKAKANQLTAIYSYQQSILNGFVEVSNELQHIKNLKEMNLLKRKQKEILGLSVVTAQDLYRATRATYLEVLLTQQNFLQSQLEFVNAGKQQQIAKIKLYKALGGGWQ
jgi:NodT family efflux transporter outer membrane factor (OMF) lipoprotein